jgi:formylglycine-generating enzyme required for sulfatase activity
MPDQIASPARRLVIERRAYKGQYFSEPLDDIVRLDMMLIPAGTFQMGSSPDELDNYGDEQPQHSVAVPLFFMARTSITQAQWRIVAGYPAADRDLQPEPSHFKGDQRPVESVDWDDATEFCQRLSQKTGRTYRLPSEAEWEYACRAGTTTPFHFGETLSDELANYCAQDREIDGKQYKGTYGRGILGQYRQETTEVAQFPANPFGLYDMHGNVWEWCEDDWHDNYEGSPSDGKAWVESERTEMRRVVRGGSWYFIPRNCRSACRYSYSRDLRNYILGFRVCCAPPRLLLSP